MMRRWVAVLALIVSLHASAQVLLKPFDPYSDPEKDLQAAEQKAQAEHKNILMDVGGNWCGPCLILDRTIREDPELSVLLEKNYVLLEVNYSKENPNKTFLGKYPPFFGNPAWYVLSADGRLLWSAAGIHGTPRWYEKEAIKKLLEQNAPKTLR